MRILITGGAGFVGSSLAKLYREKNPKAEIVVFDNLKRRGSEMNLSTFKSMGIEFVHGDIRNPNDLKSLNRKFDLMIEASAEPSVLTGMQGDGPMYAIETNLYGTVNALEFARSNCDAMVFLSTSRVYSIPEMKKIALKEGNGRFELNLSEEIRGLSVRGISEEFSTKGFRSIYGSSKLASELLIQEYVHAYGLKAVINRCGVIAGPGQFGKVDQGVFTFWVARHYFKRPLKYTGFGGKGFQVRDLMHPSDLFSMIEKQNSNFAKCSGEIYNVGGGNEVSTSLYELTQVCREVVGNEVNVGSNMDTASVDVPYYITDATKAKFNFEWKPEKSVKDIVSDIHVWIKKYENDLRPLFDN